MTEDLEKLAIIGGEIVPVTTHRKLKIGSTGIILIVSSLESKITVVFIKLGARIDNSFQQQVWMKRATGNVSLVK